MKNTRLGRARNLARVVLVFVYFVLFIALFAFWPFIIGAAFIWLIVKKVNRRHFKPLAISVVVALTLLIGVPWAKASLDAISGKTVPTTHQTASSESPKAATSVPAPAPAPTPSQPETTVAPPAPEPAPAPTPQPSPPPSQPLKTTGCQENNGLPDPACTPGATDPKVTQDNISSTICVSGYTSTVRPSTSYTNNLKTQQITAYGYSDTSLSSYEEDHFIPLEVGGSPDNPANLWPEPYSGTYGAKAKDKVENYLHSQVCNGGMSLADAQNKITTNWETVYDTKYGSSSSTSSGSSSSSTSTNNVSTPTPSQTPSQPSSGSVVKLSTTGICHAPGTTYYDRTTNFTPYPTLDACLAAGGRMPKR